MRPLPETFLQFGAGKFLRAFADCFIHQANESGQAVGRIVVVQTTGTGRADLLRAQAGRYHVVTHGLSNGTLIDRTEEVASISRALVAARQWPDVLAVARTPELRCIISNTAEAGYVLDPADTPDAAPPRAFPAKLLVVLRERFRAGQPGVMILPCELHENNGDLLQGIVLGLAKRWDLGRELCDWMRTACRWPNTLVDRIVTGSPREHPLLGKDRLLTVAEPYALWVIQEKPGTEDFFHHPAIRRTPDVQPFFLRKVRILNAAHTALVSQAVPRGIGTVRQALENAAVAAWLNRLLFEEIVPVLEGRVEDPEGFARQTLERFRNPFLDHQFKDIAVYHDAKVAIRLVPTRAEYLAKFGRMPPLLNEAIEKATSVTGGNHGTG